MLSKKDINKFQEIYKKEFGILIIDYNILTKPIPRITRMNSRTLKSA